MKYMGSKARFAKHIVPEILKRIKPGMVYIEPFVGGANVIDKIPNSVSRYGYDINPYLIAMWQAVSGGWVPPEIVTEEDYISIRGSKESDPVLAGYAGFALSYGGKFFGGWCRDSQGRRDYVSEAYRNAAAQFPKLSGVHFECKSVFDLAPEKPAVIYCDPPYAGTTKYATGEFDHGRFYDWCFEMWWAGHTVILSEYSAPDWFTCVWEKETSSSLTKDTGSKKAVEKLFILEN